LPFGPSTRLSARPTGAQRVVAHDAALPYLIAPDLELRLHEQQPARPRRDRGERRHDEPQRDECDVRDDEIQGVDPFAVCTISAPSLPMSVAPDCLAGLHNAGTCWPGERFSWEIPQLAAGQTITVTVPYRLVTSPDSLADGVVLPFRGLASHASAESPDVALRAVPEPGAALAGAAALLALGWRAARRR